MAHQRKRHGQALFSKLLGFSPLVGVFGHRQVGKTTFVADLVRKYITLDDDKALAIAEASPREFLTTNASPCTALDECQLAPKLFPALKEWVRTHKKPGQFVLTGSVRFSSRRAIRESLTGRLVSFEMYPMVLSELLESPLPDTLPKLLSVAKFDRSALAMLKKPTTTEQSAFNKYLEQGGLPGLCFVRQPRLRQEGLSALIDLILDRDLRLVTRTLVSLTDLRRFLQYLAKNAWQPHRYAEAQRQLRISEITQKKLLYGFESIYLIRRIKFEGLKGETFLLEDQFEEAVLSENSLSMERKILGALFRNLRAQLGYRLGSQFDVSSYETRGGASVPLVFRSEGKILGVIVLEENSVSLSQKRSADSFLRHYPEAKLVYACLQPTAPELLEDRVLKASAASLITS